MIEVLFRWFFHKSISDTDGFLHIICENTFFCNPETAGNMLPPLKSLILKWGLLAQWIYWAKYLQAILACPAILLPGHGHVFLWSNCLDTDISHNASPIILWVPWYYIPMNHLTFLFSSVALIIPDLSHQVLNSRKEMLKHTHIQRFFKTSWTCKNIHFCPCLLYTSDAADEL